MLPGGTLSPWKLNMLYVKAVRTNVPDEKVKEQKLYASKGVAAHSCSSRLVTHLVLIFSQALQLPEAHHVLNIM
jgi:hypothetical protein